MIKEQKTIKIINLILIFCILSQFVAPFNISKSSDIIENLDEYDVILFWGQSNMVGFCGGQNIEKESDTRYNYADENSVKKFSNKSGIDIEILANSEKMNFVRVKQEDNTVYEYKYTTDELVEITENTQILGETLKYNSNTKKLGTTNSTTIFALQQSKGTNMIPQFCKTYYEKTGRKVVAVFAANGGQKIQHFLPSDDNDYADPDNQMIYEAMVEKYKSAINYMEKNGYTIKNKLWVSFQGESNAAQGLSTSEYKRMFLKVHNYLKQDLQITQGAIVETSHKIENTIYKQIQNIHQAQEELAAENEEIIIGSSYSYDRYLPDKETYNSSSYSNNLFVDENGKKITYEEALNIASSGVCYPNNTIHFTSAALSQIGKESAENLAIQLDKVAPEHTIIYSDTKPTMNNVQVTIELDEKVQEVEGWTLSADKMKLTKIYTENKEEIVEVYDLVGNKSYAEIKVLNIDRVAPKITVNYSTTKMTNGNIEVTIEADEKIQEIEGWFLSSEGNKLTKVYTKNQNEEVTIFDIAGNSSKATIYVENIDKIGPELEVLYSTTKATNQDVEVTVTSNEKVQKVDGWNMSEDGKKLTKIYKENTTEYLTIYDLVGNSANTEIKISNIDKVAPKITITYSNKKMTNDNVEVTIEADEKIQELEGWTLSDEGKKLTTVYDENTNQELTIYDFAGNSAKTTININNIDKIGPEVKIVYSTTTITNQDVGVTITSSEQIQGVEGWTLSANGNEITKSYSENTSETVVIYDLSGNKTNVEIKISNIDKTTPILTVNYSTKEMTNDDIEVVIQSHDEVQQLEGWILSEDAKKLTKIYANNKQEDVVIYDSAGNSARVTIDVKNIDKVAPELEVLYSTTKLTNHDVTVMVTSNEKLQGKEGWALSEDGKKLSKVYKENNDENIKVYDVVGNESNVGIKISNIDKTSPEIVVNYSTKEMTTDNVKVSITSQERLQSKEGWTLLEDEKTLTKLYMQNISEELTIYDIAGNVKVVNISIKNIHKIDVEQPIIDDNKVSGEKLPTILPNAGTQSKVLVGIILMGVLAIYFYIKTKKFKDID